MKCIDCPAEAQLKRIRCSKCLVRRAESSKTYRSRYKARHYRALNWFVPASQMSAEALYQAVRHEREVVSWAWRNPV